MLLKNAAEFYRLFAEKAVSYAINRHLHISDEAGMNKIMDSWSKKGYGFKDLVLEIVKSDIFRSK